jgi:hypothetical protein
MKLKAKAEIMATLDMVELLIKTQKVKAVSSIGSPVPGESNTGEWGTGLCP